MWVVHHLEIIGEAVRSLSEELRSSTDEVNWRAIIATRNVLLHSYFEIDLGKVWAVVDRDLPHLRTAVMGILARSED